MDLLRRPPIIQIGASKSAIEYQPPSPPRKSFPSIPAIDRVSGWPRPSNWPGPPRHVEKAAFEMARTGNEGGLYAVLKAIAGQLAEEYAEN